MAVIITGWYNYTALRANKSFTYATLWRDTDSIKKVLSEYFGKLIDVTAYTEYMDKVFNDLGTLEISGNEAKDDYFYTNTKLECDNLYLYNKVKAYIYNGDDLNGQLLFILSVDSAWDGSMTDKSKLVYKLLDKDGKDISSSATPEQKRELIKLMTKIARSWYDYLCQNLTFTRYNSIKDYLKGRFPEECEGAIAGFQKVKVK